MIQISIRARSQSEKLSCIIQICYSLISNFSKVHYQEIGTNDFVFLNFVHNIACAAFVQENDSKTWSKTYFNTLKHKLSNPLAFFALLHHQTDHWLLLIRMNFWEKYKFVLKPMTILTGKLFLNTKNPCIYLTSTPFPPFFLKGDLRPNK